MYKEESIIIKYEIPNLGEYAIDENMTIFKDKSKIVTCSNLNEAKETVSKIANSDREDKISNLRKIISDLELQNLSIDNFRKKNNFS